MRLRIFFAAVLLATSLYAPPQFHAQDQASGPWIMQQSGTTASLRGIHAAGPGVAWASGTGGTVLRTEDSGYMWQSCALPPGAEKLDFRGIWAWDANTAIVMSSGSGDQSRLYKTTDGCSHWTLLYTNPDKDGFWDAVVFLDRSRGIILGDPTVNHSDQHAHELNFTILKSFDGGATWRRDFYDHAELSVTDGYSAFAASNSSLGTFKNYAWFGTGGKAGAYVFVGDSYNPIPNGICDCFPMPPKTQWFTHRTQVPVASGNPSSGIFSLAFRDLQHGVAVGGDYLKPNDPTGTAASTVDGGLHWTAAATPPHGYRSAVAWDADARAWIAVGPNGSDVSRDNGRTWQPIEHAAANRDKAGEWNALSLPWVVGPRGRIGKLDRGRLPRK